MYKIKPLEWTINNTACTAIAGFYIDLEDNGKYRLDWSYLDEGLNVSYDTVKHFINAASAKKEAFTIYKKLVLQLLIEV